MRLLSVTLLLASLASSCHLVTGQEDLTDKRACIPNDKDRGGTQHQQFGSPSGLSEDRAASSAIPSSDAKSTASNAASTRGIDGKILPLRSMSFLTVGPSTRPTSPTNGIQGLKADDASFASSQSSALLPLPGQPKLLKDLKKLRRQMNAIITDHGD